MQNAINQLITHILQHQAQQIGHYPLNYRLVYSLFAS